jgi:hypothetical protein
LEELEATTEGEVIGEREVCGEAAEGVVLVKGVLEDRRERAETIEGDGLQAAVDSLGVERELGLGAESAESLTDLVVLVAVGRVEGRREVEDAGGYPALVD